MFGPTPDVSPGTAGGFSSTSAIARRTPIRLRVTDDIEQPVMFFLSWKNYPPLLTLDALRILDAAMRRRLFERAPVPVMLNGEQIDYADIVAAVKAEFPNLIVLRYTNAQRVPEGTRIASTMWQYLDDNQNTLALI